ncbi:MAG: hypothetical protein MUE90_11100 [Thermoanaerobaculales bacterium]|nr:hypothetical protein [Thermoanaerobaculales bacterium]
MSLINDALRKARQAASEHDGLRAGGRAPRAYPGRGARRGAGIGAVALVAVAAALAGAAGAWWWAAGRGGAAPPQPAGASGARPAPDDSAGPAAGGENPSAAAAPVQPDRGAAESPAGAAGPSQQQAAGRALASTAAPASGSPGAEVEARPEATGPPAADRAVPGPSGAGSGPPPPSGGRVFILDAELGATTLSLGYIVFRPVRPFAEINGVEVYEGTEIEGFTVERIEADRVVLRDADGPLELRVP